MRRALGCLVLGGAFISVGLASAAQAATTEQSRGLAGGIYQQINDLRASRGLPRLTISAGLTAAASAHSLEMAKNGFFDHESMGGGPFWKRIEKRYAERGFTSWDVGENLLWQSPSVGPAAAVEAWLNSPPHRANLLSGVWREIGIAAVHSAAAPGFYRGREVTIVTVDFGARR